MGQARRSPAQVTPPSQEAHRHDGVSRSPALPRGLSKRHSAVRLGPCVEGERGGDLQPAPPPPHVSNEHFRLDRIL